MSPQTLAKTLWQYFGNDMSKYLKKSNAKRIVIMMDTYEALWGQNVSSYSFSDQTDSWVRDLVSACPGILFTILGKEKLHWDDYSEEPLKSDYSQMLTGNQILLGELSKSDANKLLISGGINNNSDNIEIRKKIIDSSKGLPFYLIIQLALYHSKLVKEGKQPKVEDFGGTKQKILDSFNGYLPDHEKKALRVLGQTRIFNKEIFKLLQKEYDLSAVQFNIFTQRSFIQKTEQGGQYLMHQIMQEHLQNKLRKDDYELYNEIHSTLFEYYDKIAIVKDIKNISQEHEEAFTSAFYHKKKLGFEKFIDWFYLRKSPFDKAYRSNLLIKLYKDMVNECNKIPNNNICAGYQSDLGQEYKNLGDYNQAEQIFRDILKRIGESHKEYSIVQNQLAQVLDKLGQFNDAEFYYKQAISNGKHTSDKRSQKMRLFKSSYAHYLAKKGNYNDAKKYFQEAIDICKDNKTLESLKCGVILNNFGLMYNERAEYQYTWLKSLESSQLKSYQDYYNNLLALAYKFDKKAKKYFKLALSIFKAEGGIKHPEYSTTLSNLAIVYHRKGNFDKAEKYYRKTIEIDKQSPLHPDHIYPISNLADMLKEIGKFDEADQLYRRAIEISELLLDNKHEITVTVKANYQIYLDLISNKNQ